MPFHILMVADDQDQSDLFTLVLERADYRVTAVSTAAKALEKLASDSFDLILTDYMLPDFNGDELIKRARAMGIKTNIVMMSNHVDASAIARASQADGCYLKDDIYTLVRIVANHLAAEPA